MPGFAAELMQDLKEDEMRRIAGHALGVLVGVIALAGTAVAGTIPLNGGFEDGTGSVPTGWSAVDYHPGFYPYYPDTETLSDATRVASGGAPFGSYVGYVSTDSAHEPGELSGLRSGAVDVTASYVTFRYDFLSSQVADPPAYFFPINDSLSLIIRSTGDGAPADRTFVLFRVSDFGSDQVHSSGFIQDWFYVGDRIGHPTTFEFALKSPLPLNYARSEALIDGVEFTAVSPVPLPPSVWSGAALLAGLAGFGWLRLRREKLAL